MQTWQMKNKEDNYCLENMFMMLIKLRGNNTMDFTNRIGGLLHRAPRNKQQ